MQGGSQTGSASPDCSDGIALWSGRRESAGSLFGVSDTTPEKRAACLARAIETEVIPRLVAAHRVDERARASNDSLSGRVSQGEVVSFTDALLGGDEPVIDGTLESLRRRGFTVESLLTDLLAPAARQLGHLWTEDLCSFTDVTIGLGRLQRMMRELSPAFGTEVAHPPNGRRVLLVRAPGEQHSFGLSMVAEFFRRAGWEVAAGGEGADTDPITAVRREWFDAVGFSAGSEARLDWLPGCIAAVRRASIHPGIAVLVGGPVFMIRPQLARQLGADATAANGSDAPGLAESLLAGRVKRS